LGGKPFLKRARVAFLLSGHRQENSVNVPGQCSPFKCSSCEHALVIDIDKPPDDDVILCCQGCGKEFGSYAKIKEAALVLAKAEFDSVIEQKFADVPFISMMELTTAKSD
jgi:hypothetical protein